MGGGSGSNGKNKNSNRIFDTDGVIDYTGSWILGTFSQSNGKKSYSYHSTSEKNATFSVPFNGSQIQVIGMIPPGEGELRADYNIDNGDPVSRRMAAIQQNTPLYHQMFFVSPVLEQGLHNLTVQVLETGNGRNYSFQMFKVQQQEKQENKGGGDGGKKNQGQRMNTEGGKDHDHRAGKDAAIVGGVLGSIIFLLVAFLVAYYFWRRKRLARIRKSGEQQLPPMMYYARPLSDGTQRGLYTLEPATTIDTDSKFTFAARRDVPDGSHQSWVPVNLPPSMPTTALVSDRPISKWSSYKGSSVIMQPSHPEVSRFSAYTTTVPSPVIRTEWTDTPTPPNRRVGSPSQNEILVSSPRRYDSRTF